MADHAEANQLKNVFQIFFKENPDFCKRGFENLLSCWYAVIENEDDYMFDKKYLIFFHILSGKM